MANRTHEELDQGIQVVAYSIYVLGDLYPLVRAGVNSGLPAGAWMACREVIHSHLRVLIEFACWKPDKAHIRWSDFVVRDESERRAMQTHLQGIWNDTSVHISHRTWGSLTSADEFVWEEIGPKIKDVLIALEEIASHVRDTGHRDVLMFQVKKAYLALG